jgi:hypothetical protein
LSTTSLTSAINSGSSVVHTFVHRVWRWYPQDPRGDPQNFDEIHRRTSEVGSCDDAVAAGAPRELKAAPGRRTCVQTDESGFDDYNADGPCHMFPAPVTGR